MRGLRIFSITVLVAMVAVTAWASLEANVLVGFQRLLADRWGVATLFDAYFGFLWFWLWIAYKEGRPGRSLLWLLLLLTLGNQAMAAWPWGWARGCPRWWVPPRGSASSWPWSSG